ncbi:MAG: aspartate aminotransferase family protein [Pseudonocardiales bacterium]
MGDNSREAAGSQRAGSQYAAALAARLARIAPGDLDVVHLCSTAAEAVEVALTLAQRAQGLRRSGVVYVSRSSHGETRVPGSMRYRSPLRRVRGDVQVPFGDAGALADALRRRRVGTVILETVQGGAGVDSPPPDYLHDVRRLCDEHGALWIADEAACGVGRTGRFFAFEHAGVVPDLVTLAKSLGDGAAGVSAVIARGPVYRRACPDAAPAITLGAFSGTAEACCAALQALAVLYEEDLIGNAERTGRYLLRRLEGLRQCYPQLVTDVRGRGLMVGVQLAGINAAATGPRHRVLPARHGVFSARHRVLPSRPWVLPARRGAAPEAGPRGDLACVIGTLLLAEHGVLVAFTDHDRHDSDVLRLEPPLTIRPDHVDHFVDALDELLSRGPRRLAHDYLRVMRPWRPDPPAQYEKG